VKKHIPADFTLTELRSLLQKHEPIEGFLTREELQNELGVTKDYMLKLLHAAKKAGVLEFQKDWRERLDGVMYKTSVYKITLH